MEKLVAQAEYLASQGVRELIVVAQETTVYGKDLYGEKSLHILLRKLCRIPGIQWIRILYCYPEGNLSGTDPDYERRKEDLPLSGPSYPAL